MSMTPVRLNVVSAKGWPNGKRMPFNLVSGLQLPDSKPLAFNHYAAKSTRQIEISFPEEQAQRIQTFAEQCFVDDNRAYDCSAFVGYVMGWEDIITIEAKRRHNGPYVQPDSTQAGRPYHFIGEAGHIVLGTNNSNESLSVLDAEGPLVVARNTDLMRAYGSTALFEITQLTCIDKLQ